MISIFKHRHNFDENGKQLCCTQEEKINYRVDKKLEIPQNEINCCDANPEISHPHNHGHEILSNKIIKAFLPAILSLVLLLSGIFFEYFLIQPWFIKELKLAWFIIAYIPVGYPVLKEAFYSIKKGVFFSEFLLMSIATIGAFFIGEYHEAVAVMLFYNIGEILQSLAVSRAKENIKFLIDQRPDKVTLIDNNTSTIIYAEDASINDIIQIKAGEKLALDGTLISDTAIFNTAALTGESIPNTIYKGESVLAGMINLNTLIHVKVTNKYQDSKLSKILELVQNATKQKAPSELFIRKFAKIYTPIVVYLALAILIIPFFFSESYSFETWLYRAMVFLVISCPCALVISIPLGYFGGIGAASKNGILFKGGNFLDEIAKIQHIIFDKTGTLTEGVFKVQHVDIDSFYNKNEILSLVNALENLSTHPIAKAIEDYIGKVDSHLKFDKVEEYPGFGLKGIINNNELIIGNHKLLEKFRIPYNAELKNINQTIIAIAYNKKYVGYISIADKLKDDARSTIDRLKSFGIKISMLSGDNELVVQEIAQELGISNAYGSLLPEDKINKLQELKVNNESTCFVGDGVNDAPVIALSDVGMAMGGLGSDAAIETAGIIIQDDQLYKIPMAIKIGKQTKNIVWQNIIMAFAIKAIVLVFGAFGYATLWEAVFADVGVALLAILNAVRIQNMNFR